MLSKAVKLEGGICESEKMRREWGLKASPAVLAPHKTSVELKRTDRKRENEEENIFPVA